MKKQKVLVPILFILLFFVVLLGCSAYQKIGWWHSNAEESTTTTNAGTNVIDANTVITNGTNETLMAVNTTFYNYLYDREIYDNARDQGAQGCFDTTYNIHGNAVELIGIPYGTFDSKLSDYYKKNYVKSGIYTGNFYNYYGGLPGLGNKKIDFPGYYYFPWAANIANRTPNYNSVCQGIVCADLKDFDINNEKSGTLMTSTSKNTEVAVPYFDSTFLDTTVTVTKDNTSTQVPISVVKDDVYFPFRKITTGSKAGYYEFDSTKDVVRFQGMDESNKHTAPEYAYYFGVANNNATAKLKYEYHENDDNSKVYSLASDNPQFLPFNRGNYETMGVETESLTGTAKTNAEAAKLACQKKLDYGFGIRYNIPFYLSSDGKVDGKNMVFEFSGDDDVWVFLDGKLVMDLGGQHGKASGTIDFGVSGNNAQVTIANVTYVKDDTGITSDNATDTATSNMILQKDTTIKSNVTNTITGIEKGDTHKHIITVFYLERGMFESNFHMAFNFVPANVPKPQATPEPEINNAAITDGSLKIQNEMVFPTTQDTNGNPVDKINAVFLGTVKGLAEDDVFQYSIENKGTEAQNVGDSGIKYPSGKLTVRKNGETNKEKTSYLSFGTPSTIRIYFDMSSIQKYYSSIKSIYVFSGWGNFTPTSMESNSKIYYFDVSNASGSNWLQVQFSTENNNNNNKAYIEQMTINLSEYDGKMFKVTSATSNQNGGRTLFKGTWEAANNNHPALGGGTVKYSSGLPFQDAGTDEKKFTPTDTTAFYPVSDTAYEMTEAHLAATNSNILVNETVTSGITDENGLFNLFYDDSATFLKQFATGSRMKVVQKDSLMTPERYTETLSESLDASTALTTFISPTTPRKTSDYYYTTIKAESKGVSSGAITTAPINVTYDGQFYFSNATGMTGAIDITQTFTNTVKTGSLTISKELHGNMEADNKYQYGFKVMFSNVFGGGSTETVYTGSYTLVAEDGTKTSTSVSNNIILLKPNEKAIISGIPVGTTYKIVEVNKDGNTINDGSVVSKIQTNYVAEVEGESITSPIYTETSTEANITVDKETRTILGKIPCSIVNSSYGSETNKFTEVNVSVAYTNQFGAITISKIVAGDTENMEYYAEGAEKTYTFTVTQVGEKSAYSGNYWVYTYDYSAGANKPPKITKKRETATNGTIILKSGQKAEIGGISLVPGTDKQYVIKEIIADDDIFFVESLVVTSGTGKAKTADNTGITTQSFSGADPTFDVIYSNRYSNAYIQLDKYVDKKYYNNKIYATEENIGYQELTNANQSFVFKVKQYKTLAQAEAGGDNYEASYDVVLNFENDTKALASSIEKEFNSETLKYSYKFNKTIRVLGNRYYRIEEDTNWSWKYTLKGVAFQDATEEAKRKSKTIESQNVVILKTYLDSKNEIEDKIVPVAEFYNALDTSKADIEGDTDIIPNEIKKK